MPDILDPEQRSKRMAAIKGRGNKSTELALIRLLRDRGINGWRRHARIFGRPDFVFPRARLAVFVDGCFWHGCPKHYKRPAGNSSFWELKIEKNRSRDRLVDRELRKLGWTVLRVWEHSVRRKRDHDQLALRISAKLSKATV